jgi:hypothetical protein
VNWDCHIDHNGEFFFLGMYFLCFNYVSPRHWYMSVKIRVIRSMKATVFKLVNVRLIAIGFETSRSWCTLTLNDGPFVLYINLWEPCYFAKVPDGPQTYTLDILCGSKKKEPRYACVNEAKASHSQRMWTEVSSSAPHLLHSGLSDSPIRWRCLLYYAQWEGQ